MKVYITSNAHAKLWAYVRAVNTEIGGWGYASLTEGGDLVWDDAFLVPQIVSSAEVDFESTNGDAVAVEKAINDGVLDREGFVWVSWHSHHTMKPFWSNTDDDRIKALRKAGIQHLLSFVGCHDHTCRLRYDAFNVEHAGITIPQVTMDDLTMVLDPQDELFSGVLSDIDENVKERKWATKSWPSKADAKKAGPAPAKQLAAPSHGDPERISVDEAFEIKSLMEDCDMSYNEAVELVKGEEWFIGPAGVTAGNFDQLAWGD